MIKMIRGYQTRGDIRHAVEIALRTWPDKTQQAIADQVGCNKSTVSRIQDELLHTQQLNIPATRTGKDGKQRPTTYNRKETPDETETENNGNGK